MQIRRNMSEFERVMRAFIASFIAVVYFANYLPKDYKDWILAVAVYLCLTSLLAFSPTYHILKKNYTEKKDDD